MQADAANHASDFISALGKEAIAIASNEGLAPPDREQAFRRLLRRAFAVKGIARFVLGRYWRQASAAQRTRFAALFEDYVVKTYGRRFNRFRDDNTYRVTGERDEGRKGIVVLMKVARADGPPVALRWRVKRSKQSGDLKIVDLTIEGISLAVTQRSIISAAISAKNGNIDLFLEDFSGKVAR